MNDKYLYLFDKRHDTDWFKSQICHMLKNNGDIEFIKIILKNHFIENFWNKDWYFESLYLVAMIDYLSFKHEIPYLKDLSYYRTQKLKNIVYPLSAVMMDKINNNDDIKEKMLYECENSECGKFFLRYNIIEKDIRDVV